jgi:hypothetical protein
MSQKFKCILESSTVLNKANMPLSYGFVCSQVWHGLLVCWPTYRLKAADVRASCLKGPRQGFPQPGPGRPGTKPGRCRRHPAGLSRLQTQALGSLSRPVMLIPTAQPAEPGAPAGGRPGQTSVGNPGPQKGPAFTITALWWTVPNQLQAEHSLALSLAASRCPKFMRRLVGH